MIFLWCVAQLLAGWYVSDFISSIYHIALDRFGSKNTFLWGPQIAGFRLHHKEPRAFLRPWYDWSSLSNTILSLLAGLPFILLGLYGFAPWFLIPLGIGFAVQDFTHKASHMFERERWEWVTLLQRLHLILPPQVHSRHHKDFDGNYSVLNGWSNPLFNWLVKRMTFLPAPKEA